MSDNRPALPNLPSPPVKLPIKEEIASQVVQETIQPLNNTGLSNLPQPIIPSPIIPPPLVPLSTPNVPPINTSVESSQDSIQEQPINQESQSMWMASTPSQTKVASVRPSFGSQQGPNLWIIGIIIVIILIAGIIIYNLVSSVGKAPTGSPTDAITTLPPVVATSIPTAVETNIPFPSKDTPTIISEAKSDVENTVNNVKEALQKQPNSMSIWGDTEHSTDVTLNAGGSTVKASFNSQEPSTKIVVTGTSENWTVTATNLFLQGSIIYDSTTDQIITTMK